MPVAGATWREWLSAAQARLEAAGIEEVAVKLRWVTAHLLGTGLMDVYAHHQERPEAERLAQFHAAVDRLEKDEPVQYVIGETDFMGRRIRCDRRALIPRPETELLVECAEEYLHTLPGGAAVVDVCTGSGCIACALARRVPHARVAATDIRPEALALAGENAREWGVAVEWRRADLLEGMAAGSMDLVVSNPPYIRSEECDRLPRTVRVFEPRVALDGGRDGLDIISRLVEQAAHVLTSTGRLMMEIGDDQADAVMELLCRTPRFKTQTLRCDFAGRARVAIAERTAD